MPANTQPIGLTAIKQAAANNGVAWQPLAAIAHHESNLNPDAVGDNGTSFGLFQLHQGGALPAGTPVSQAENPQWNAAFAARAVKALGIQNLPYAQQTYQISKRFERPTNVAGETQDANNYLRALGTSGAAPAATGTAPQTTLSSATPQRTMNLAPLQASLALGQQQAQKAQDALGALSGNSVTVAKAPTLAALTTSAQPNLQPTSGTAQHVTVNLKDPIPSHVGTQAQKVIELAKHYLGTKYVYGGASPKTGFDCSGLIQYIEGLNGTKLPRTAAEQSQVGQNVAPNQLQPGDRLYFQTEGAAAGVTHTALYIGDGQLIEAPHTGDVIKVAPLAGYYQQHLVGAKRGG